MSISHATVAVCNATAAVCHATAAVSHAVHNEWKAPVGIKDTSSKTPHSAEYLTYTMTHTLLVCTVHATRA